MAQIKFQTRGDALKPGGSYAQPFELLEACHERVQRSLDLLQGLTRHLEGAAVDAAAREAAQDVLRYFDIAAPQHHEDEERHVFALLEQGEDAPLREACTRLREEHVRIDAQWAVLSTLLRSLLAQPDGARVPAFQARLAAEAERFVALHAQHLVLEQTVVFPAAQARADTARLQAMGREMAARRGLRL